MSDGGKGSSPRPFSVSNEEYAKRWDVIFGRDMPDPRIMEDAQLEDEAFNQIKNVRSFEYDETDEPNRNTSNF
jgi:hypothetical protein